MASDRRLTSSGTAGYTVGVANLPNGIRLRLFGVSRVSGVDAALGASVFCLLASAAAWLTAASSGSSHEADPFDLSALNTFSVSDPLGWLTVVSAERLFLAALLLFATIAGVSVSLRSGGYEGLDDVPALQAHFRVMLRSALLACVAVGFALASQHLRFGPFMAAAELLVYVATLSVLDVILARCGSALLFSLAAGCAAVLPIAARLLFEGTTSSALRQLSVLLPWAAILVGGMAIGRLNLRRMAIRLTLLSSALTVAAAGFAGLWVFGQHAAGPAWLARFVDSSNVTTTAGGFAPNTFGSPASPFVVLAFGGTAIAFVAACLVAGEGARWALLPLSASGSLALSLLTIFTAVAVVTRAAAAGSPVRTAIDTAINVISGANRVVLTIELVGAIAALAVLWRVCFGDGALERLCTLAATRLSIVRPAPSVTDAPKANAAAVPTADTPPSARSTFEYPPLPPDEASAPAMPRETVPPAAPSATVASAPPLPQPPSQTTVPVRSSWSPGQSLGRLPY